MKLPLPRLGSTGYYLLLAAVALLVLGPLGGITAAYMNFAIGTFVGGQVLAGILGSVVTLGYGPEGKHGANYMQTMAASVAGMSAMGVLIQAMVWLGMPMPPAWQLILFFLCIGMFGVGVGMLYTPILVDRLKLTYPSGLAVANILRALTDVRILRRSVATLGGGLVVGIGLARVVDWLGEVVKRLELRREEPGFLLSWASSLSVVTVGGGMIVGARITASAILVGAAGVWLTPWLRAAGYLGEHDPFRKIGFIFALGTILGAAIVDLSLLARDALARVRAARAAAVPAEAGAQKTSVPRLIVWVLFWAAALLLVSSQVLHLPVGWIALALLLALVFQMVNGISQGITDQNPISSAFVVSVLLMSLLGLRDPLLGLFAGSVLLVSCTVGVDMQQDRSTGWRLGSNRAIQFRFQMLGVVGGALLAVIMARLFLEAYPVLKENLFAHPELSDGPARGWQSTMTYKFVGILHTLDQDKSRTLGVMGVGIIAGLLIEVLRKLIFKNRRYLAWKETSAATRAVDFALDALLLASPYASSFGGFVDFQTSIWWGLGGIATSVVTTLTAKAPEAAAGGEPLPEDMSATSLVGGGFIAGDSLFALYVGLSGLVTTGALWKILAG